MIGGAAFLLGIAGLATAKAMEVAERRKAAAYRPEKISHRQCVIHEVIWQSGKTYGGECGLRDLSKMEQLTIQEAAELATEIQCRKEGTDYHKPKFNDIFLSYKDVCGKTIGKEEAAQIIRERIAAQIKNQEESENVL